MKYLPLLAIVVGVMGWQWFAPFAVIAKICIFGMLFFTFLRMPTNEIRIGPAHLIYQALQLALSFALYFALLPLDVYWAQAVFLCIITPVATASPTIVSFFSGDTSFSSGYVLLTHTFITFFAPWALPWIGHRADISFLSLSMQVIGLVAPMVVLPILLAIGVRRFCPSLTAFFLFIRQSSFVLWVVSVVFILAKTIDGLHDSPASLWQMCIMFGIGLLCCVGQYLIGFAIGKPLGVELQASRQAWGQKNTTLSLWLSFVTLSPVVSLAPASYIVWQNIVNSYLLIRHARAERALSRKENN